MSREQSWIYVCELATQATGVVFAVTVIAWLAIWMLAGMAIMMIAVKP